MLKNLLKSILRRKKVVVGGMESTGSTFVYQLLEGLGAAPVKVHHYVSYGRLKLISFRDPRDIICSYARRQRRQLTDREGVEAGLIASHEQLFGHHRRQEDLYRYRDDPRAVLYRYEAYFGGGEARLLDDIVERLELEVDSDEKHRLLSEFSIKSNQVRSEQLDGFRQFDRDSQIHGNHISNAGRSGGWTDLFTPAMRDLVKADLGQFLIDFEYERDLEW